METVIILGAAGRIGDAAARAFVERGWKVKGLARNARASTLAPGVEAANVDAFDREALIAACRGADVIVNALNPLYTEWEDKVLPMARNVAAAAGATGATHMMPGNVYNYGHAVHMGMREDALPEPSTEKARIRIDMENLFAEAAAREGVRTVVLRAGDFYGGTRTGSWLDLMILTKLAKDVFTWPGPVESSHAFAYLPDLGRTFAALAERRREMPAFETFHFPGHTLNGTEAKQATETAVGRQLKLRGVPWPLVRVAALFSPMMREIVVMSYLWRTPHSLDGSKLKAFLGEVPDTDPVEAIRRAIADLKLDRPAVAVAA